MKTKQTITTLLFTLLCTFCFTNSFAVKKNISGSGNVIKEDRTVSSFTQIVSEGVFSVYITQGTEESVMVEADDNIAPHINTEVRGDKLTLSFRDGVTIRKSKAMKIHIVCSDLTQIVNEGVGKVTCENDLKVNNLELINEGVGSIDVCGVANEVTIENSGVGSVKAYHLIAKVATVENSGIGSVKVSATEKLVAENSGIGSIKYGGNPAKKHLTNDGLGSIKAM